MGEVSGLSFRRGTTTPQTVGVPESTIASHGRWETLAYASYLHVHFSLHTRLAASVQLQLSLYDSRLWARSRRFRQMEPHSVSYSPLSFGRSTPCSSRLVAALPAVVGTADHSHGRAAIRVDRPISLVYVSRVMSCLSIYTRPSLPCTPGAQRRGAMRNDDVIA